jgi:hypothetical protein
MNDTETTYGEVTYTRVYEAPRDLVFRCMITPGPSHPLLGSHRREYPGGEHHRRSPSRWGVRDRHGQ